MASWAGFFSPVSGQIYFPALNPLARDLHVSASLINLTLTSYMVRKLLLKANLVVRFTMLTIKPFARYFKGWPQRSWGSLQMLLADVLHMQVS